MTEKFDLVVVGAGPGGYSAAIRARQLGLSVALVEKDSTLGGTCLNVGCIPSKALLDSSHHYAFARKKMKTHGIEVGEVGLNLEQMMRRKLGVVSQLNKGLAMLMDKNGVQVFRGVGALEKHANSQASVQVIGDGGAQHLQARYVLLATGSVPQSLRGFDFAHPQVVDSTRALSLNYVPQSLAVVGGGAIGLEMASVWSRLGSKVSVVEYREAIGGVGVDEEAAKALLRVLSLKGVHFVLGAEATGFDASQKRLEYRLRARAGQAVQDFDLEQKWVPADLVLVAVGRRPYTESLGLEAAGVQMQNGFVVVDEFMRTSVEGVYAIGDLVPGAMLAHVAEEQGVAAVEHMVQGYGHVNTRTVPSVIYTHPELASVGMSERDLKGQGVEFKAGRFPFSANGRALVAGEGVGFVKILAHAKTDKILGAHIVGPHASDLLAEVIAVMEFDGSSEDVARSFHAHPTFSEAVREAAWDVQGLARSK